MTVEAAIIGGGPAGAATALLLARAGRDVVLLEREAGAHDKVCGEFISHEAAAYLDGLGIGVLGLGAAPIGGVRLAGRQVSDAALPFAAFSLSRRRLDEALLQAAGAAGVEVRRGVKATGVEARGEGWRIGLDRADPLDARAVFLAVGKHNLKGRPRPPGLQNDLVAFKMHLRLAPAQIAALGDRVELCLFPGGYAGLEPIEDGLANLCLVARKQALPRGDIWPGLLRAMGQACPLLAERLEGAHALWPRPLTIAAIPYGLVQHRSDGLWRLGDQAAVIPSFAGDGLAIALHSAHAAAGAYLAGQDARTFQADLARDLRAQVTGAALLSQALVRPWGQALIGAAVRLEPRLLAATASLTRISTRARRRATGIPPAFAQAGISSPLTNWE